MKVKTKILALAALLSVLFTIPLVFGLGIVDFPKFSSEAPLSTASVFVDPSAIIKDYELDPGYQIGDKFTLHVNVSGVTDLFVWQVKIGWNEYALNVSSIIPSEFLATSPEQTSSEALGWVMNSTTNATSAFAESILGNVSGVSGSGRLVSIEFNILGYNYSDIIITVFGHLQTTLIDSEGVTITIDTADGFFRNKYIGDVDGDGDVDWEDFGDFALAYGSKGPPQVPTPEPDYNREADFNVDGDVDWEDFGDFALNYGRP